MVIVRARRDGRRVRGKERAAALDRVLLLGASSSS